MLPKKAVKILKIFEDILIKLSLKPAPRLEKLLIESNPRLLKIFGKFLEYSTKTSPNDCISTTKGGIIK